MQKRKPGQNLSKKEQWNNGFVIITTKNKTIHCWKIVLIEQWVVAASFFY